MEKLIVWGSPHTPTEEQLAQLKEMGELVYLKEVNPDLYGKIASIQVDTDLKALAQELIRSIVDLAIEGIDREDDPSRHREVVLVQPAGNPMFHIQLGMELAFQYYVHNAWIPGMKGAFSTRRSKDVPQEDGSVRKVAIFVHEGWQEAQP